MKLEGPIIWVGGFFAVLLMYAAYKNESPVNIFRTSLSNQGKAKAATTAVTPATVTQQNDAPLLPGGSTYQSQVPVTYVTPYQYSPGAIVSA